ncbi:MAG: DNA repair protein RecO [Bacteroidota bacterium]
MLVKTRGLVFKNFKYRDTSIIVKMLTEQLGIQTYIVNGVRSKKANTKIALYQPLTFLDMVVYSKPNAEIHRISEAKCLEPFLSIPYNIKKSAMAVFLAETLYKCIKEEEHCSPLFNFIHDSLFYLDALTDQFEDFHLQFLFKLSDYLGFGMRDSISIIEYDVLQLLDASYNKKHRLTGSQRRDALKHIIEFYKTHIDSFGDVKSLGVLKEVLS